jgi:4'-phosphopantetheinyl transferase
MMQIAAVFMNRPVARSELGRQRALLDREKARRLERFRRDEDFQRGLLGDLLIRSMISRHTGLDGQTLVFGAGPLGKPCLVEHPNVEFNMSHSGAWVVCALDRAPVGVDVEQIKPIEPDLSRRFFSADEDRRLRNIDAASRLEQFFMLWTLKESYAKMTGLGLALPLQEFSMVRSSTGGFGVRTADGRLEDVHLAASDRLPGHALAACGHSKPPIEALEIISMDQLLAPW